MITAVSSGLKSNTNIHTLKQKNVSPIAFAGKSINLVKQEEKLLNKLTENNKLTKALKKNEIPVTKKPLVAADGDDEKTLVDKVSEAIAKESDPTAIAGHLAFAVGQYAVKKIFKFLTS